MKWWKNRKTEILLRLITTEDKWLSKKSTEEKCRVEKRKKQKGFSTLEQKSIYNKHTDVETTIVNSQNL